MICEKCGLPSGGYPRMSLRDYFAAMAMSGLLGNSDKRYDETGCSEYAYKIADAMLKARGEEGK